MATPRTQGTGGAHLIDVSARVSRHALLYGLGSGIGLALALVNAIVLTRYLPPAAFGQLGLLLLFASLLTIAYNAPLMPGTLMRSFGASDDEDVGEEAEGSASRLDRRRVMGTGIVVTAGVGVLGTALVAAMGSVVPQALGVDVAHARSLTVLASVSGALGALWRITTHMVRMERRPVAYVTLSTLRPVLVIALVWILVANGHGLPGALVGVTVASALAVVVALVVVRRNYRIALERSELGPIVRGSVPLAPIIIGFWVLHNADMFILVRLVTAEDLGLYRLATRIAAIGSHVSSSVFMAWTPMESTSAMKALDALRGRGTVRASMLTYFVVIMCGVLLALVLLSDVLVQISPETYAGAAQLVPLLGLGFFTQALLVALYRSTSFRRRGRIYRWTVAISAATYLPICALFATLWGTVGGALATTAALVAPIVVIWWRSQHGRKPVPFQYGRMAAVVLVAAACAGFGLVLSNVVPTIGAAADVLALVLYPIVIVGARVIPRDHLNPLVRVLRGTLVRPAPPATLHRRLETMSAGQRAVLMTLAEGARPAADDEAQHAVTALARLARVDVDPQFAGGLGQLLFGRLSEAERRAMARGLYSRGLPPEQLAALELWREQLGAAGPAAVKSAEAARPARR